MPFLNSLFIAFNTSPPSLAAPAVKPPLLCKQSKKRNQISLFSGKLLKVHPHPIYFQRAYKNSA